MRNTSIEIQTYQWSLRGPAALLTAVLFALFWGRAHSPSANALGEEPAQDESAGGAEVHVTGVLVSPSATNPSWQPVARAGAEVRRSRSVYMTLRYTA